MIIPPIIQVIVGLLVLVAGIYDILWRRIPNWLVMPGFLIGIVLNTFIHFDDGHRWDAAFGFALAMATYLPLYLLRGMGAGDVKLAAAIGALVGWQAWIVIFILSGLLGGVLAIILMIVKGRARKTFSNLGYIVWEMAHFRPPHLGNEELDIANPRAMTLPHGAVIALGTLLFLGMIHSLLAA
ncbi:MAG: A24 family peptidase [Bryobacteraceae bacterium]